MTTAVYDSGRFELFRSASFDTWFRNLRDARAKARIAARLDRLADGHPGDARAVGGGISELRIDHGPGYRVYFMRRGPRLVLLLAGGDKGSQSTDIKAARRVAAQWEHPS